MIIISRRFFFYHSFNFMQNISSYYVNNVCWYRNRNRFRLSRALFLLSYPSPIILRFNLLNDQIKWVFIPRINIDYYIFPGTTFFYQTRSSRELDSTRLASPRGIHSTLYTSHPESYASPKIPNNKITTEVHQWIVAISRVESLEKKKSIEQSRMFLRVDQISFRVFDAAIDEMQGAVWLSLFLSACVFCEGSRELDKEKGGGRERKERSLYNDPTDFCSSFSETRRE